MDYAAARQTMVDNQIRTYDVTNKPVVAAFESVPREAFVPAAHHAVAYSDLPVTVSAEGASRTALPPLVLARMLQALEPRASDTALDVAGGSGYAAALLETIVRQVTLLEESEPMAALARSSLARAGADKVEVVSGKLHNGHAQRAPYDLIVIEGAVEVEPEALFEQLAEGGRLVCVVGLGRSGRVKLFTKRAGTIGSRIVFDAAAPALPAFFREKTFVF